MIPGHCIECGSLPITKPDFASLECAICYGPLCDGCALFDIDGESTALSGEEITDEERQEYRAFCAEHEGQAPARRPVAQ